MSKHWRGLCVSIPKGFVVGMSSQSFKGNWNPSHKRLFKLKPTRLKQNDYPSRAAFAVEILDDNYLNLVFCFVFQTRLHCTYLVVVNRHNVPICSSRKSQGCFSRWVVRPNALDAVEPQPMLWRAPPHWASDETFHRRMSQRLGVHAHRISHLWTSFVGLYRRHPLCSTALKRIIDGAFLKITEEMLAKTWTEIELRLDILWATNGAHFKVWWTSTLKKKKKTLFVTLFWKNKTKTPFILALSIFISTHLIISPGL